MKKLILLLSICIVSLCSIKPVEAHCEIPCGIYGDSLRIALMYEAIATVKRSIEMIEQLSSEKVVIYHQLVRWVINKEAHATRMQDLVTQYFLCQRVKIVEPSDSAEYKNYVAKLELLHKLQVYAMLAKQQNDLKYTKLLNETLHKFEHLYFVK